MSADKNSNNICLTVYLYRLQLIKKNGNMFNSLVSASQVLSYFLLEC